MADPLREPIIRREPYEVRADVAAALLAEKLWLCRSGQIDEIYRLYPCFNSRSAALDRLCNGRIAKRFPDEYSTLVAHCHDDGLVSLVLQVSRRRDKPEPAANDTINVNLLKLHEERA